MPIFDTDKINTTGLTVTGNGSSSSLVSVSGTSGIAVTINDIASSTLFEIGTTGGTAMLTVYNDGVKMSGALRDSTGATGASGTYLKSTGSGTMWATASGGTGSGSSGSSGSSGTSGTISDNLRTERLEMGVSSTTTITTGAKGRKVIGYAGTIQGWRLVSDQNSNTTLDVWKANASIPTVANTITGSAKPSLSATQYNGSTALTGWTTGVTAGDVFVLNVDSNSAANYLCLEIDILLNN